MVGLSLNHISNPEFNLDKNFLRILKKRFPYSKIRVEFKESQRKFYNSARSQLYGTPALTMQDKKNSYFRKNKTQ